MQQPIRVDAALAVYARLPLLGAVKTRLAAGVGAAAALQFYQEMLIHTLQQARRQVCVTALGEFHVVRLPNGLSMHGFTHAPDRGVTSMQAVVRLRKLVRRTQWAPHLMQMLRRTLYSVPRRPKRWTSHGRLARQTSTGVPRSDLV